MKKGCLIFGLLTFSLLSLGLIYYFAIQNDKNPEDFESTKPTIENIIKKAVASGNIKPRKEVFIKPQVSGIIEKLFVIEGDLVTKGQKIAKIKLIPSEVNINSATSQVSLAQLRFQDAQRELSRQQKLNAQKLDIEQAKNNFENAKKMFERNQQLFEEGVISEQELENISLDMELKKSIYENIKISSSNSIKQLKTEVAIRSQELQAAKDNLQLLKVGATQNSAQVSNIIRSTMAGMVLDVPIEEGSSVIERNNFNEGTSVATVADMTALLFEGEVDESDVGKLKVGMPLVIKVGAIDDQEFDGVLEAIAPKGKEEEGTVKFEIRATIVQKAETFLRAGYSANADIIIAKKENVISINERDILFEEEKSFVEKETNSQEYKKIEIKTGLSDGILIEVLEGTLDTATLIKIQKDRISAEN